MNAATTTPKAKCNINLATSNYTFRNGNIFKILRTESKTTMIETFTGVALVMPTDFFKSNFTIC